MSKLVLISSIINIITSSVFNQCIANEINKEHSIAVGLVGLEWYSNENGQIHDIGTLWTCVSNHGVYGHGGYEWSNFEWPGASENNYNWEGRFWCGAIVDGEDRCSHASYGNYEFYPTDGSGSLFVAIDGRIHMAVNFLHCRGAKSELDSYVKYDDESGLLGVFPLEIYISQRGLSWSIPEYDDFIAFEVAIVNKNKKERDYDNFYVAWNFDADICYLDQTENYKDDLVDYDGWDGLDSKTDELPTMYPGDPYNRGDIVDPYDWDSDGKTGYDDWGIPFGDPDNPNYNEAFIEPDGFPDEYTLLIDEQRGQRIIFKHPDLPDSVVVYGFAVPRNMSYMYDGDHPETHEDDFQEREQTPYPCDGYIGGRLIYTPNRLFAPGAYHNYSGPEYISSDSLMMSFCHSWWDWDNDPGNDREKLQYMDGRHEYMRGKRYMVNPHHPDFDDPVFDYRWLQSAGPFYFPAGDTLKLVYAVGVGRGLKGLRENLDNALKLYYLGSKFSDPYHPSDYDSDDHWKVDLLYQGTPGDVNNDGIIDVRDVVEMVKHILGSQVLDGEDLCSADCDADGRITVEDVLGVVGAILGSNTCEP